MDRYMHNLLTPSSSAPTSAPRINPVAQTLERIPKPADPPVYTYEAYKYIISFWKQGSWTRPTGGRKGNSTDPNHHSAKYMQKPDGTFYQQSDIRPVWDHLYELLEELGEQGHLRPKLKDISRAERARIRSELTIRCPDLKLCDNEWKARKIMSDKFPGWYRTYQKKRLSQSIAPLDNDLDDDEHDNDDEGETSAGTLEDGPVRTTAAAKRAGLFAAVDTVTSVPASKKAKTNC